MTLGPLANYLSAEPSSRCSVHLSELDCAAGRLDRYVGKFAGALFDPRMDEPWWNADRVLASDLAAVSTLSMDRFSKKRFRAALLDMFDADHEQGSMCSTGATCTAHFHCPLKSVPPTSAITDSNATAHMAALNRSWDWISSHKNRPWGLGFVGKSKLLTRKRPALLPILDEIAIKRVTTANAGRRPDDSWLFIHGEIANLPNFAQSLAAIRTRSEAPTWMTDLRILDVLVWMRDTGEPCS